MQRLRDYFTKDVSRCPKERSQLKGRGVGFEVETLFVDKKTGLPISREISQKIFLRLAGQFGWKIEEVRGDTVVKLSHQTSTDGINKYKHELFYELGWNNLEIVSPVWFYDYVKTVGFPELEARLQELYQAAAYYQAKPLQACYDGQADMDTLVMPDKRDEIWLELDGPVLTGLGHIASVHVNIDLHSIGEGFKFIRRLNQLYERKDWPPPEVRKVWDRYVRESRAGYETRRYGPPPKNFKDYLQTMAGYKVVMNRAYYSGLYRVKNPQTLCQTKEIDLELFTRSVWWWNRLRVRGGDANLVLEARTIPRSTDEQMSKDIQLVLQTLGLQ